MPLIERSLSLLLDLGIYEGDRFLEWIRELLAAKNVHTFADLVRDSEEEDKYRHTLQVVASDVSKHELLVLPRDAARLGIEPDELDVALAVRMSMSIPIFFEPVVFENPKTGENHLIVDGGMLSNFPVWLFDCDGVPDWPTFGMLLVEPKPKLSVGERLPKPEPIAKGARGLLTYVKAMAQTMMEAHDRLYIESADYARTVPIPTLGVGTTAFDLSRKRKQELYDSGRTSAEKFLETWDFDAYITAFRSGREQTRRQVVNASIAARPRRRRPSERARRRASVPRGRRYTGDRADVAQLAERGLPKPEVAGSIPVVRSLPRSSPGGRHRPSSRQVGAVTMLPRREPPENPYRSTRTPDSALTGGTHLAAQAWIVGSRGHPKEAT